MVNVEIESQKMRKEFKLTCPRCGSDNIRIEKRGFDYCKGCCGYYCFGLLGFFCGGHKARNMDGFCLNCGFKFDAEKIIIDNWQGNNEPGIWMKLFGLVAIMVVTLIGFLFSLALLVSASSSTGGRIIGLFSLGITLLIDYLILRYFDFLSSPTEEDEELNFPTQEIKKEVTNESPGSIYCSKCGKQTYKDAIFCKYCGNRL